EPADGAGRVRAHPRRILVVDDDGDAAEGLALLLRTAGHAVCTARDGRTALQVAAATRPQVVFLDIGMPGMDGYEVARQLREHGDRQEATILVAVTGYGQEEDRLRSRQAGFDYHMVKPVDPDGLLGLLLRAGV